MTTCKNETDFNLIHTQYLLFPEILIFPYFLSITILTSSTSFLNSLFAYTFVYGACTHKCPKILKLISHYLI